MEKLSEAFRRAIQELLRSDLIPPGQIVATFTGNKVICKEQEADLGKERLKRHSKKAAVAEANLASNHHRQTIVGDVLNMLIHNAIN